MAVRLGIDTGGTFTDLIGIDAQSGSLLIAKTPSTPARPVDAVMSAIELSEAATEAIAARRGPFAATGASTSTATTSSSSAGPATKRRRTSARRTRT